MGRRGRSAALLLVAGALLVQLLVIADQQLQLWASVLRARALPGRPRHTEFHAGWTELLARVGQTVPMQEPVAYFFDESLPFWQGLAPAYEAAYALYPRRIAPVGLSPSAVASGAEIAKQLARVEAHFGIVYGSVPRELPGEPFGSHLFFVLGEP